MAIRLPKDFLMHQLACPGAMSFTPLHLRNALLWAKGAGFRGMVIVPKACHPSLGPKTAAEIAGELDMKLQTCGFLPGDQYDPHTSEGLKVALEELHRQAQFQVYFDKTGCGGDIVCGPIDIGWKGKSTLSGYANWLMAIETLGKELELRFAIESLNGDESDLSDPFGLLVQTIADIKAEHTFVHFDTGHADRRKLSIEFFEKIARIILILELVNRGREPLSQKGLIDFDPYLTRLHLLRRDCQFSIEPFEPADVSGPLGLLDAGTVTNKLTGYDSMWRDRQFLLDNGVMRLHH